MKKVCQFNPERCDGKDCECYLQCKTIECNCGCVTFYDKGEKEVQCEGCPKVYKRE